jgi:hypothetical protein
MRDLNYQLKELCRKNRDGSYASQAQRLALLTLMANQLHELGYRHMEAQSLKPKHVEASGQALARGRPRHRDDEEPHGGAPLVGGEGRAAERHCAEQ